MTLALVATLSTSILANENASPQIHPPVPVGGYESLQHRLDYPSLAKDLKLEAKVVVSFRVDKSGQVHHLVVEKSAGRMFDEVARDAVQQQTWLPATWDDQPIDVRYSIPIHFSVEKG